MREFLLEFHFADSVILAGERVIARASRVPCFRHRKMAAPAARLREISNLEVSMRSFTIRLFILLTLLFPAIGSAQVANYAGVYSGALSGGSAATGSSSAASSVGAWEIGASSGGQVVGVSINTDGITAANPLGMPSVNPISGTVLSNGSFTATTATGATITGTITLPNVSGSWANPAPASGIFAGAEVNTTVSNPLLGTWQGTMVGSDSASDIWTRTLTVNSNLTWTMVTMNPNVGTCTKYGTYSYTSTTFTSTTGAIFSNGSAVCNDQSLGVAKTVTLSSALSGSGANATLMLPPGSAVLSVNATPTTGACDTNQGGFDNTGVCMVSYTALTPATPSSGTGTHTANGTYTYDSGANTLALDWTTSNFAGCDGPTVGKTKTQTGVVITATSLTWANDNMVWTRPSGTAGNIVGTWYGFDPSTGNTYTLTINSNNTMSVTANVVYSNPACGTFTASGTYTWNGSNSFGFDLTTSDFVQSCNAPPTGQQTIAGVSVTATTMTWPGQGDNGGDMVWTRASGTASNVVGTWTSTDSSGNTYTLALSGSNSSGTANLTGVIVSPCNQNGNQNLSASANSEYWPNGGGVGSGYYVSLQYTDAPQTATSVSVSGPGISGGSEALTYNSGNGSWNDWTQPSTQPFWATLPANGLPYTYTFTIVTNGATTQQSATVSCFQQLYATNLSPTGQISGTGNPTFNWTGINDANPVYGVQVNDGNGNQIWQNNNINGTSIVYNGPALTPGATYNYNVVVNSSSTCNNGASFAQGSFTYGAAPGPSVPTGLSATAASATQVNLSWSASSDSSAGIVSYNIYRNSSLVNTVTGTPPATGFSDTNGLVASTPYSYTVQACDANNNCSAQSSPVSVTTLSGINYMLTITQNGPNVGATGITPIGQVCNTAGQCTYNIPAGTVLTISANAPGGSTPGNFSNGTGSATSCATSTCTFTMNTDSSLTATFDSTKGPFPVLTMMLAGNGAGGVTENNDQCNSNGADSACQTAWVTGSMVTLQAIPTTGSNFAGYSGACNGNGVSCSFAITANSSVTATFNTATTLFDGTYTGTWSDNSSDGSSAAGTFTITLTNGVLSNYQPTITSGAYDIPTPFGSVSSSGAITATSSPQCGGITATFTGQITSGTMTVNYSRTAASGCASESGTLTATLGGSSISFVAGWNLVGNSVAAQLPVATLSTFGDPTKVSTVWKWETTSGNSTSIPYPAWAFYTPSTLYTDGGAAYAAGKRYDALTTINGGEGFWVYAIKPFTVSLPSGAAISSTAFHDGSGPTGGNPLPKGWSLIATGDNPPPRGFVNLVSATQPAAGSAAALSLISIWAWNPSVNGGSWYFYAPDQDNGGTLGSYSSSKNYLNFYNAAGTSALKTLDATTGFWVNHP
jgi:hypothetical protein